ncbi:hypothetical protein [Actinoplanes sp. NPDC020271]|uniref:hypothetical protein n=1 Tax=Actinoplanes sp. NPDC020271 TaxID=3363896 RepID=UPI0037A696DA
MFVTFGAPIGRAIRRTAASPETACQAVATLRHCELPPLQNLPLAALHRHPGFRAERIRTDQRSQSPSLKGRCHAVCPHSHRHHHCHQPLHGGRHHHLVAVTMHVKIVTAQQIQSVLAGAAHHLTLLTPAAALTDGCPDVAAAVTAVRRGVRVRVHVGSDRRGPCPAVADLAVLPTATVPCRMAVIDGKILVAAQNGWDYTAGGAVLASPGLASMIERSMWRDAAPRTGEPHQLPYAERAALTQLTLGVTDDLAARSLGIATRSYRRTVAALMQRLSADSRFQAGYRAAKANLL